MAENIDIEKVRHIARLSRLELTNSEEEKFAGQLSSILGYVAQLSEVETKGVDPMANISGLSNIMRDDKIEASCLNHQDIEKNAPEFENGSFVVPGVFE